MDSQVVLGEIAASDLDPSNWSSSHWPPHGRRLGGMAGLRAIKLKWGPRASCPSERVRGLFSRCSKSGQISDEVVDLFICENALE